MGVFAMPQRIQLDTFDVKCLACLDTVGYILNQSQRTNKAAPESASTLLRGLDHSS